MRPSERPSKHVCALTAGAWARATAEGAAAGLARSGAMRALAREVVLYTMILESAVADAMRGHPLTSPYARHAGAVTVAGYGVALSAILAVLLLLARACCGGRRRERTATSTGATTAPSPPPRSANRYAVPPSPSESTATKASGRRQSRRS